MTKYFVMMGVRVLCFVLMVVITPYGWYTWLFAVGAIFLPYLAVVIANVGQEGRAPRATSPERQLPAAPPPPPGATAPPTVLRIHESGTTPSAEKPPADS